VVRSDGPTDQRPAGVTDEAGRRLHAVVAGHRGDEAAARQLLGDGAPSVRAAALGALARMERVGADDVLVGLADASATVRERATRAAGTSRAASGSPAVTAALVDLLDDRDPLVVEATCWALGERAERVAVPGLAEVATRHPDPRCREGAVAALGAIGDPAGLAAVLEALGDKPTVRRRAAVALAGFDGPEVGAALERCRADRDWQVRQVADRLLAP
jgi:HEAT repeat protein